MNLTWEWRGQLLPFVFLLLALGLGTAYALLMPPAQVPDEVWHFYRAYGISLGSCMGGRTTTIPQALLGYQNVPPVHPADGPAGPVRLTPALPVAQVAVPSANLYNCVPYVPAAFELFAARHLNLTVAHAFYLGRLVNLGVYAALVCLALRLLPAFQISLLVLALMPMTLHQAASFSADSLTLASSFLLIAYCLHLAFGDVPRVRPSQIAVLSLLMLLCSLCKFNLWFALLVLLIPKERFGSARRRWLALAVCVLPPCLAAAGWQWLNQSNLELYRQFRLAKSEVDIQANARVLMQEPGTFLSAFGRSLQLYYPQYAEWFIGRLGPLRVALPSYVLYGYGLLLAATLMLGDRVRLRLWHRALLVLLAVGSFISLFSLMWTFETTPWLTSEARLGVGAVSGVQGRYFIPFALPLMVALSWPRLRLQPVLIGSIAALVLILNTGALTAVWHVYHGPSPAGLPASGGGLQALVDYDQKLVRCECPGSSPENGKVYIVAAGQRHWVLSSQWIKRHGFKWPADVHPLRPDKLARIPEGRPLTLDEESSPSLPLPPPTPAIRFEGKLVRQPGSSPEQGKIYLVHDGARRWILDGAWIEAHGYHQPQDVVVISKDELDSIPLGEAIQ